MARPFIKLLSVRRFWRYFQCGLLLCLLLDCEMSASVLLVHRYGCACSCCVKLKYNKLSGNLLTMVCYNQNGCYSLTFFEIFRFRKGNMFCFHGDMQGRNFSYLVMPVIMFCLRSVDQQIFLLKKQWDGHCPDNRHTHSNTRPSGSYTYLLLFYTHDAVLWIRTQIYSCRL
jgi:hypothetical protein